MSWPFLPFCLLFLAGCQRGCAYEWLTSHGVGQDHPKSHTGAGSLRLDEVDCPAGLARCAQGTVELSQAFRHPEPCAPTESCACPWQVVGQCQGGCVAEDLEIPLSVGRAKRLCSPSTSEPPVALPPSSGALAPVACGDEQYRCNGSSVVACGPPRVIALCTRGCAEEGETLDDPAVTDPVAVLLLCDR